jgi:hypothetical protein
METFKDASESANHCQRNWNDLPVSKEIIDELISVATNMPTKQNEEFFTVLASVDKEFNHNVYMHSYSVTNQILNMPFDQRHKTNYNTQLRAPLIFQWLVDTSRSFKHGNYNPDGLLSIGVSAGAVALAANKLGLKTGFCICLHKDPIVDLINKKYNTNFNDIALSLGIGYERSDTAHNVIVRPDGQTEIKSVYRKTIKHIFLE